MEDYSDSLGDLLLAESVYQMAKGNRDRASAALRIMNSGGQVLMPEFVRTPMKGKAITHRTGIIFIQRAVNTIKQGWTNNGTPRSLLSPDLNYWLSLQLPDPSQIKIISKLNDGTRKEILLSELNIEPLDLLYTLPESFHNSQQCLLVMLVQTIVMTKFSIDFPVDEQSLQVDFKDRSTFSNSEFSMFEISSLLATLKKLLSKIRPISPNDFLLPDRPAASNDKYNASELKKNIVAYSSPTGIVSTVIQSLRTNAAELENAIDTAKPESVVKLLTKQVIISLQSAWQNGVVKTGSEGIYYWSNESLKRWIAKAGAAAIELEDKLNKTRQIIADIPITLTGEILFNKLQDAVVALFDQTVPVFPFISPQNITEINECYTSRSLIENAKDIDIDEWMREAALVRKQLSVYRRSVLIRDSLLDNMTVSPLTVLQLPFFKETKQAWIGGKIPVAADAIDFKERASLSLVFEMPGSFIFENSFSGFIIDEWPEWIPESQVDTGVTFQYNQPGTEPPQSMLLAVTPVEAGNWKWEHLTGAVDEALEMAKKRLVTPDIIKTNPALSQVLPAVILPFMKENDQTPVAEKL